MFDNIHEMLTTGLQMWKLGVKPINGAPAFTDGHVSITHTTTNTEAAGY